LSQQKLPEEGPDGVLRWEKTHTQKKKKKKKRKKNEIKENMRKPRGKCQGSKEKEMRGGENQGKNAKGAKKKR
jgi:hypothetical protein